MSFIQGFVFGVGLTMIGVFYSLRVDSWWKRKRACPAENEVCEQETQESPENEVCEQETQESPENEVCEQETQELPVLVDVPFPSAALTRFGEAYSQITGEPYTVEELWCLYNRLVRNPEHRDRQDLALEEQP